MKMPSTALARAVISVRKISTNSLFIEFSGGE
jgi:hypothetical protein